MNGLYKIVEVATGEVIRQDVIDELDAIANLLNAYNELYKNMNRTRKLYVSTEINFNYKAFVSYPFIVYLGNLVVQSNNGFRKAPVVFKNGHTAIPASQVTDAINALVYNGGELTTKEWIHEFLKIHPFVDGNGRVAWLLQNAFEDRMENPIPLWEYEFVK